jgi:hypothetical protein
MMHKSHPIKRVSAGSRFLHFAWLYFTSAAPERPALALPRLCLASTSPPRSDGISRKAIRNFHDLCGSKLEGKQLCNQSAPHQFLWKHEIHQKKDLFELS